MKNSKFNFCHSTLVPHKNISKFWASTWFRIISTYTGLRSTSLPFVTWKAYMEGVPHRATSMYFHTLPHRFRMLPYHFHMPCGIFSYGNRRLNVLNSKLRSSGDVHHGHVPKCTKLYFLYFNYTKDTSTPITTMSCLY